MARDIVDKFPPSGTIQTPDEFKPLDKSNSEKLKCNPDEPLQVTPIEPEKNPCDNGSGDGRMTAACCDGPLEGENPEEGFIVLIHDCKQCVGRSFLYVL